MMPSTPVTFWTISDSPDHLVAARSQNKSIAVKKTKISAKESLFKIVPANIMHEKQPQIKK